MHAAKPVLAAIAVLALALTAGPAAAGHGAIAYDQYSGKQGASWDQPTEAGANELALRQCASKDCQVHPVEPKGCGALAVSSNFEKGDKAWGGADRETLDEAKRAAIAHCQGHTSAAACAVRIAGCNK